MSARRELADALAAELAGRVDVTGYTPTVDGPLIRPRLLVWQAVVEHEADAPLDDRLRLTFEAWLLTDHEDVGQAEDALDDALDDVLEAFRAIRWVHWDRVERGIYDPDGAPRHGYNLTAHAFGRIGDDAP